MPNPEQLEYARLLVGKAEADARACDVLSASTQIADDVVGFHAQQAVEKALKAALVVGGVDFPRTHDLGYLIELVAGQGIDVPEPIRSVDWLTPWAAELRYDEPPAALDRPSALAAAKEAVRWSKARVDS